jgi:hypothetical protein
MSAVLENTAEEIEDLVGATIEKAWIASDVPAVRIRVRYRSGLIVNGAAAGEYELWQDEEGNGPGFVAYMGPPS